jgi:hypothetical protein
MNRHRHRIFRNAKTVSSLASVDGRGKREISVCDSKLKLFSFMKKNLEDVRGCFKMSTEIFYGTRKERSLTLRDGPYKLFVTVFV